MQDFYDINIIPLILKTFKVNDLVVSGVTDKNLINVILNFEKEIKKASFKDEADAESIASARASRISGITDEASPDDFVD